MTATASIADAFAQAAADGRAALIAYVVAGDPDRATTLQILRALSDAGVDLIELGVPYGDPLADGPTIAAGAQRALDGGMRTADAIALAAEAREAGCAPIVLFTYANPVDKYGIERFARDAAAAGVAGVIIPDLPLEELDAFTGPLRAAALDAPLLVAPTTPPERAARIARASSGFVYLVSRLGVTGAGRGPDAAAAATTVAALRAATDLPIAVGFGVSAPSHVTALAAVCDGVIVGSALIDAYTGVAGAAAAERIATWIAPLVSATSR
jgi:tryptophan synthase alpha chain